MDLNIRDKGQSKKIWKQGLQIQKMHQALLDEQNTTIIIVWYKRGGAAEMQQQHFSMK